MLATAADHADTSEFAPVTGERQLAAVRRPAWIRKVAFGDQLGSARAARQYAHSNAQSSRAVGQREMQPVGRPGDLVVDAREPRVPGSFPASEIEVVQSALTGIGDLRPVRRPARPTDGSIQNETVLPASIHADDEKPLTFAVEQQLLPVR